MKTVKFVPKVCTEHILLDPTTEEPILKNGKKQIIKPLFKGDITLQVPSFDEILEITENIGLLVDAKGDVIVEGSNPFAMLRKLVKASQPFYKEVAIERADGSEKFSSFDDLNYEPDCAPILSEVGYLMRRGFRPGKN